MKLMRYTYIVELILVYYIYILKNQVKPRYKTLKYYLLV